VGGTRIYDSVDGVMTLNEIKRPSTNNAQQGVRVSCSGDGSIIASTNATYDMSIYKLGETHVRRALITDVITPRVSNDGSTIIYKIGRAHVLTPVTQ